jgi:hypothetical protein
MHHNFISYPRGYTPRALLQRENEIKRNCREGNGKSVSKGAKKFGKKVEEGDGTGGRTTKEWEV